jgi:hypothetical protein
VSRPRYDATHALPCESARPGTTRRGCPCPAHQRIAAVEVHRPILERAASICESRAESLARNGQGVAANEALKCAEAIRRSAMK